MYKTSDNTEKIWTKITGYNNMIIFKKTGNENVVDLSIHKYNLPYKSQM